MKAILRNTRTGNTDSIELLSSDYDQAVLEVIKLQEDGLIQPEEEVTSILP